MRCFLDRDGIINVDIPYVGTIDRFTWHPEIFDIMNLLKSKGYRFSLITNQSGIGRGYYKYSDFFALTFFMLNELYKRNIEMEINFCPHTPKDNCRCRKPMPGMLEKYEVTKYDIFIGDKLTDMEAAAKAGIANRWLVNATPARGAFTKQFSSHQSLLDYLYSK